MGNDSIKEEKLIQLKDEVFELETKLKEMNYRMSLFNEAINHHNHDILKKLHFNDEESAGKEYGKLINEFRNLEYKRRAKLREISALAQKK